MNTTNRKKSIAKALMYLGIIFALIIGLVGVDIDTVKAVNPPPYETYFVPLPDDWLMQHMEDIDANGGDATIGDPYPPIRDVIGISISAANTLIYYDQWEDGGYDTDIANPGANVYSNPGNLDGTQIWGDGNLSNGCPPRFGDITNPCTAPVHDLLQAGDVIVLDNLTPLDLTGRGAGGANRRSWIGSRLATPVTFDGKDKLGATYPVAVTRAGWAVGTPPESTPTVPIGPAGSLLSDATGIEATSKWGTSFVTPAGTDTSGFNAGDGFNYSHVTIQASQDNTRIQIDINKDGDTSDAGEDVLINAGQQYDPSAPGTGGLIQGVPITTDKPVQVLLVTGDINSTWATRWYNIKPQPTWTSDYYTPVGTNNSAIATATAVWVYNPNPTAITVNYDFPGGASPDGNFTVTPGIALRGPDIPINNGAHFYTTGTTPPVFYPFSVTERTGAQLYDWGFSLIPANLLTDQYLVGWAPGCTTAFGANECNDQTSPPAGSQGRSRSVVWVTAIANTIIYVDLDGSGITCPGGAGSERSISPATALVSYTINDDPGGAGAQGDYDMSGTRLRTCDGTRFAAAWGQNPSLSYSGDDEGLDMGTVIFPLGSNISIDKSVNSLYVTPGGQVLYTYAVRTTGSIPLMDVKVTDNYCAPATYSSGDDGDNMLEVGESWIFTCEASIFIDTVNTATASASPDGGISNIISAPDQAYVPVTGAIGDYVWVDEDGDGDQDAGEPGIPNVMMTLTGTDFLGNTITRTVYTDASGGYVFPDLPPSNPAGYTITVNPASMPAGLAANPTYDENGIGTANTTTVVLGSGIEHMTADFGYNWSSPTETNNPPTNATGAIGDRVWVDTDGDGIQDANEIGIPGITVQLITAGPDGLFGTTDDVVSASTTTNNNGNYIFDNLLSGAYVINLPNPPVGFTQTGDPDSTIDNQTSDPIILAPGDVFLNADFGYQPPADTTGSIGDRVWLDANADGVQDAGELGIPGVSVSLIKDLNGNGVWDAGEPIIGTDITDENGIYGFSGLPTTDGAGTDDYLVWVNDTSNVLNELAPTFDIDGAAPATGVVSGLGISAVSNLTNTGVTTVDFGFAPPGQSAGDGLIGDTIYLDRDGGNDFDPGEGLEGVVVILRNSTGQIIARTVTDENGNYSFGNLPAGTYTVEVVTNTLPNGGTGLNNTVYPDGGTLNRSTVTLTTGQINLLQDFGYSPTTPNSLGGTLWEDTNADGTLTEAGRFAGVTVELYEDTDGNGFLSQGDRLVGTTTTDSNGDYSFTGLPNGNYLVDVSDDANLLDGYWHSLGTQGEADDGQSKVDPYYIQLSGGENRTTVDFGYYRDPAALGDRVWRDTNANGIQDTGETGIAGVTVTLRITYPNGVTTTVTTVTDSGGLYSFENLLLDEDYNGIGGGQPTYTITVTPPIQYPTASPAGQGGDRTVDSGLASGELVLAVQGTYNSSFDFGFWYPPTSVLISADVRYDPLLDAFVISWSTTAETETNIDSYILVRTVESTGEIVTLGQIVANKIDPVYSYEDRDYRVGESYVYSVEVIGLDKNLFTTITLEPLAIFKQYVPAILR